MSAILFTDGVFANSRLEIDGGVVDVGRAMLIDSQIPLSGAKKKVVVPYGPGHKVTFHRQGTGVVEFSDVEIVQI